MPDPSMPEVTLLYFQLGAVGILGGLLMATPLLDMYWQGILAIILGLFSLGMGMKKFFSRKSRWLDEEDRDRGISADQVASDD